MVISEHRIQKRSMENVLMQQVAQFITYFGRHQNICSNYLLASKHRRDLVAVYSMTIKNKKRRLNDVLFFSAFD